MEKIVIAGATGFIGRFLKAYYENKGSEVVALSRSKEAGFSYWNPDKKELDKKLLAGNPIIINLCGAGIADKPWAKERKKVLLESRVKPIQFLHSFILENDIPIKHFVSASGINFSDGTKDMTGDVITETSPYGSDFIEQLVVQWESTAKQMEQFCPVSILRFGVVLGYGGALAKMLPLAKKSVLAPFGRGRQAFPWISIKELPLIIDFLLERGVNGVYNTIAPKAPSNKKFTSAVYLALGKHQLVPPVPDFMANLIFGQRKVLFTEGVNAIPKALEDIDYSFSHGDLLDELKGIVRG